MPYLFDGKLFDGDFSPPFSLTKSIGLVFLLNIRVIDMDVGLLAKIFSGKIYRREA
jgi:hypothetical protein